jgi:hypothetical protein
VWSGGRILCVSCELYAGDVLPFIPELKQLSPIPCAVTVGYLGARGVARVPWVRVANIINRVECIVASMCAHGHERPWVAWLPVIHDDVLLLCWHGVNDNHCHGNHHNGPHHHHLHLGGVSCSTHS